jgi:hypothetical protein
LPPEKSRTIGRAGAAVDAFDAWRWVLAAVARAI